MYPVILRPHPLLWMSQNDTLFTLEMFSGITTATHIRAKFKGELG